MAKSKSHYEVTAQNYLHLAVRALAGADEQLTEWKEWTKPKGQHDLAVLWQALSTRHVTGRWPWQESNVKTTDKA